MKAALVNILSTIVMMTVSSRSIAATLEVGPGKTYQNPAQAALDATPGDTILIFPATYRGTFFIIDLKGTAEQPIVIRGTDRQSVVFEGGTEGMHFSNVAYLKIENLSFTGQTGNGMNIDDGGTLTIPSHHIEVSGCDFYNMGAQGNNDFLKLSGVDSFEVSFCTFINGAGGGSGIDMVGCHWGHIYNCNFQNMGSNCIQAKGGCQYVRIENNWFENGGQRTLNLGGSTGLAFFRPQDAPFEAADLQVYGNIFIGSWAPIAFVGCVRVDVSNNTIIHPQNWIIRILQESVDTSRFLPCSDNIFRNNIIYYQSSISRHLNIGPNTLPESFTFSHNLWYNSTAPSASEPDLPVEESMMISGEDPLFEDSTNQLFQLRAGSPAIESGVYHSNLGTDFENRPYNNPPSRGAFEYFESASILKNKYNSSAEIYPNPAGNMLYYLYRENEKPSGFLISDMHGRLIRYVSVSNTSSVQQIDCSTLHPGTYWLQPMSNERQLSGLIFVKN
jgi:hypothetical protein